MSRRQLAALLSVAVAMTLSTLVAAAPSLDVRKVPTGIVTPNPSWTGPPGDPHAVWGQWILDKRTGVEEWFTHEFHDNSSNNGGSLSFGTGSIRGVVVNVVYGSTTDTIAAFSVDATVANDSTEVMGEWQAGANSHNESRPNYYNFAGPMFTTKLAASFAIDSSTGLPAVWNPPYRDRQPYIVATNNDGLAWYCWSPNNPEGIAPVGRYYVPAWDFGMLQPGQVVSRKLDFTIPAGLPNTDARYRVIVDSYNLGYDVFLNRTTSLKVSDWIDDLVRDAGVPYPASPLKASDVSVFHNYGDEPRPRDWGDAPDSYSTKAISNGANHIQWNGFCLGKNWDAEVDGQPTALADGDDINGFVDDEDGIFWMPPYQPGQVGATVNVLVTLPVGMNSAFLDAWIDFGGDGSWAAGDRIAAALPVVPGMNLVTFNVPASAVSGQTFARFRLSSVGGLPPTGMATDGEVEDETVVIEKLEQLFDFGDAPDGPYPTLLANDGARHLPVDILCLGVQEDFEADGQPDPNALGDDNKPAAGPDDEDGIFWMPPYTPGQVGATVNVLVTTGATAPAYLDAWIDFGGDGSWLTPGDQIAATLPVVNGMNLVTFNVPVNAVPGPTFARFRLSGKGGLAPTGLAADGEVEDELVMIEQGHLEFEYGDAPEGALAYPANGVIGMFPTCKQVTLAGFIQHSNFGAFFGPAVDFEADGNAGLCPLFNPNSYDQDECFMDGDAGLMFPPSYTIKGAVGQEMVVPCTSIVGPLGQTCQVASWGTNADIQLQNFMPNQSTGFVNVLMDWNQNGQWAGASQCPTAAAPEHVLVDFPIPPGFSGPLSALMPPGFLIGPNAGYVWTRFSITERPVGVGWDGSGVFEDGESEDYLLRVDPYVPPEEFDWGDAPDGPYPTLAVSNGAVHYILKGFCIGQIEDAEVDGQPDPNALGDDNNPAAGPDDEDGVAWAGPLTPGSNGSVTVTCTVPAGITAFLQGWIDFGGDGSWATLGDQVIVDAPVVSGAVTYNFPVPPNAVVGQTFARFRLSMQRGLGFAGQGYDGEVEDELVKIEPLRDFGDAPDSLTALGYPTLLINNGAFHQIVPGFCLGAAEDAEPDGQPTAAADGDDINPPAGPDDEDGVVLTTPLFPGQNAQFTVNASVPTGTAAYLDAWIDWTNDTSWATPGDQIFAAQPIGNGPTIFTVPVPAGLPIGSTVYARFRISSNAKGLPFTGGWKDGEVEDYRLGIGYKWVQKPDLTPTGIDVKATVPNILADDFLCTVSGPITDIHVWASWKHDLLPGFETGQVDPSLVTFVLSIHEDIPAGTGDIPYSRPGKLLWYRTFQPGSFEVHPYFQGDEWWWDPLNPTEPEFPGDHVVWQYDFFIREEPFYQRGTAEKPVIYWLDLHAIPGGTNGAEFGWKTCVPEDRWNDDAVIGIGQDPSSDINWKDLHYPVPHPLAPQTLDMAFALTGYPEPRDFGDAPDPTYPTLAASNGANHAIVPGFMLGNVIDAEPDGQPNANATGDDLANLPDEDGVPVWPPLIPGQVVTVNVFASIPFTAPAFLDAWIDFGGDGSWATPGDQIAFAMPMVNGPNPVTFAVPRTGNPRGYPTFARFRLHTTPNGLPFTGPWSDGEVEDYIVKIGPDHGSLTFSKAIDIRDHFWWRGNPDLFNEMLSLKVGTDLVEPVNWDSVTLSLSGGMPGDVAQIDVWQDVDANGVVDPMIDISLGVAINPISPVTIALTPPIIPANSSISALISYKLAPAVPVGNVYSFQVTGAAGTGQISGMPADIFGLPVSSCRKIVVPKPISIGEAKLAHVEPGGTLVFLQGKICTAVFTPWNLFYMEERDRSAGIGVQFTTIPAPVAQDEIVSVYGRTQLLNATELIIVPIHIDAGPSMLPKITAVGMNNKWTGGGRFGGQPAVFDDAPAGVAASGLSNVGMLVRTWGTVVWHDSAFVAPTVSGPFFWINDGSDLDDGLRIGTLIPSGVACYYGFCGHPGSFPDIGEYWGVTGILRAIPSRALGQPPIRLLVPRSFPEDLNEYPTITTP